MLHASMRRIGPVPGGAQGLIGLIEGIITPTGTLLMVLGADNGWDEINHGPEAERAVIVASASPFDPLRTPAYHEVGVLAEQFRQMPGTLVSNSPEGRFAARGARAAELLADAPWDDYYGPSSPLERLCDWGGASCAWEPTPTPSRRYTMRNSFVLCRANAVYADMPMWEASDAQSSKRKAVSTMSTASLTGRARTTLPTGPRSI